MNKKLSILVCYLPIFFSVYSGQTAAATTSETIESLAQKCAPDVSPLTMADIVEHESANHPYAININGTDHQLEHQPTSEQEAVSVATTLLKEKKNIDMGLGQINSSNLSGLGLTVENIFKPCVNLRASQTILKACYDIALKSDPPGQAALKHALSCYATGSQNNGISNGYVTEMLNVAKRSDFIIPTLLPDGSDDTVSGQQRSADNAPVYDGEDDAFGATGSKDAFTLDNTDAFLTKAKQQKGREVMNAANVSSIASPGN
ncbi:traL protein [Salmonella enterica subsp. enterica serovar Telelkebir]|nr:traL protein [Salmonella enterica subsp. enterica serovar Telelkebir]ECB6713963.1 traL protein [Salmonella enterica subsp. enterica serovar Hvittingfoss]